MRSFCSTNTHKYHGLIGRIYEVFPGLMYTAVRDHGQKMQKYTLRSRVVFSQGVSLESSCSPLNGLNHTHTCTRIHPVFPSEGEEPDGQVKRRHPVDAYCAAGELEEAARQP